MIFTKEEATRDISLFKTVPRVSVRLVKEGNVGYCIPADSPSHVIEIIRTLVSNLDREVFGILCLNAKLKVMSASILHIGTIDSCSVSTKDIFKHAILSNSCNLIAFHNHPAGSTEPSSQDVIITDKIRLAGHN